MIRLIHSYSAKIGAAAIAAVLLAGCAQVPDAAMKAAPPTQEQIAAVNKGQGFSWNTSDKKVVMPAGWHTLEPEKFADEYKGTGFVATNSWNGFVRHLAWHRAFTIGTTSGFIGWYSWDVDDSDGFIKKISINFRNGSCTVENRYNKWQAVHLVTNGTTTAILFFGGNQLLILGKPVPLSDQAAKS